MTLEMLLIKPLEMQLDSRYSLTNEIYLIGKWETRGIGLTDSEDFFKEKRGPLFSKKWVPAATLNENVGRS